MHNGTGVSRGDRNRNDRLARLRALLPATNAILGIDLADRKLTRVPRRDEHQFGWSRCWLEAVGPTGRVI